LQLAIATPVVGGRTSRWLRLAMARADPHDVELIADPHPMFKPIRER
jgi:hypothetical protein